MLEVFQGIGLLFGFISILFLAYITTRFIAGKANNPMGGKYITILDTVSLGTDKRLYLAKVGDSYVLIASTAKSIEFLTEIKLDAEELESLPQQETGTFSFGSLLDRYLQRQKDKKSVGTSDNSKEAVTSSQGNTLKKNLSKLRELYNRSGKDGGEDGVE